MQVPRGVWCTTARVVAAAIALSLATGASAATHVTTILLDVDNEPATGCTVATPGGSFAGAEVALVANVTTGPTSAWVNGVVRRVCEGGSLGTPVSESAGGWPVIPGSAPGGLAAIEASLARAALPETRAGGATLRVLAATHNADGAGDEVGPAVYVIAATPQGTAPARIPALSPLLLALAAGLLAFLGARFVRARGVARLAVVFVLAAAASGIVLAIVLDGFTGDWNGIPPAATDPAGDAAANADAAALYLTHDAQRLYVRVDIDLRYDASNNAAPNVNAGPNRNVTLPGGATLAGSASDDGLPSPPGALTYAWAQTAGPTLATIDTPAQPSTTVSFTLPGTYTFELTASDGALAGSASVQVVVADTGPTLRPIADRTIALGTSLDLELVADDGNAGDTLAYTLPTAPAGASLAPPPRLRWTPTAAQLGPHAFTARVVDSGGHADQKSFQVTVVPANRPPAMAGQADERVPAGGAFTRTLTATDPDGDALTYTLLAGPASMTLSGATLAWNPVDAPPGEAVVKVKVSDPGGLFDVALFRLTVFAAAKPVARDDHYEIGYGRTLDVPAPGVLANDADPDGGPLSATKVTEPSKGTLAAFGANGAFSYDAPVVPPPPTLTPAVEHFFGPNGGVELGYYPMLVSDLDGDGKPELIYWSGDRMYAMTVATQTLLFGTTDSLPAPYDGCAMYGRSGDRFAVGDIDDDGLPEVVMGVQCARDNYNYIYVNGNASRVAAIGYDPSPISTTHWRVKWMSEPLSPQATYEPPGDGHLYVPFGGQTSQVQFTIARLAPGEAPTVLLGKSYGPGYCGKVIAGKADAYCRIVFALDGATGAQKTPYYDARTFAPEGMNRYGDAHAAPVVADLEGQGALSILYEGSRWSKAGTVLASYDGPLAAAGDRPAMETAVVNLDDDDAMEVVAISTSGRFAPGTLRAFEADGTPIWSVNVPRSYNATRMSIADLDRDGRPDILFAIGAALWAFDHRGRLKWHRSMPLLNGYYSFIDPYGENDYPVYDLDGDGEPEVVVKYGKNSMFFLRGKDGSTQFRYDYPGQPEEGGQSRHTPIVADLHGNGHASVAWYRDVNLNGTDFVIVMGGGANPWQPAPAHFNQRAYWGSNFASDGAVPSTYVRHTTDPVTNVFGQQPQAPYAGPIVPRTRTSFTYTASNGIRSSDPATVTIDLLPPNRPPAISSRPRMACLDNTPFAYDADATDPDPGDTLSWSILHTDQSSVTIDPQTGVLSFQCAGETGAVILAVTDAAGAQAFQQFFVTRSFGNTTVPDVVGDNEAAAAVEIAAATLVGGTVTKANSDTVATGLVIAQFPLAGTTVPQQEAVDLVVSLGPAPRIVPNVVGRGRGAAAGTLAAQGFSQGATIYVYDNAVPRDTVIAQSPAAGTEAVPGAVALTVSAGSGLALRLSRTFTTADATIAFTPVAYDLAGNESPAPPLAYVVTPLATPYAGSLPQVSGNMIGFPSTTRGAFRVTATHLGTGRVASADFAVAAPVVPGEDSPMEAYAKFSAVLEGIDALLRQTKIALDADDDAAMAARLTDIVTLWRTLDIGALKLATPIAIEDGFPPSASDLAGFGLAPTADDLLAWEVLEDAAGDLAAWTAALRADGTSMATLSALASTFAGRASRLSALSPSEYGVAGGARHYAVVAGHRLPELLEALTDELGIVVGLPPRGGTPFPDLKRGKARMKSTLAERATRDAVQYAVDTINDARQLAIDTMKQAAWGAAMVAVAQHVRAFVQGQSPEAIVSGASLSIRVFNSPFSMIEGAGLESEYPDLNVVILVGPDPFNALRPLIEKIKNSSKFKLDPNDANGKYRDPRQIYDDLKKFKKSLEDLMAQATSFVDVIKKAFQTPPEASPGCVFTTDPACVNLFYPDGFASVYTYKPPNHAPAGFTGLPLPIIVIAYNPVTGQILIDTPPFLPTPE